jgi:hypothetical protein
MLASADLNLQRTWKDGCLYYRFQVPIHLPSLSLAMLSTETGTEDASLPMAEGGPEPV